MTSIDYFPYIYPLKIFFSKTIIIRVLEDIQNSLERRNKKIFMCIYMIEI